MRRTEQLQGVRMLKLRDVLSRWEASELSQLEAAELMGMSERTFRRWARRVEEEGEDGLRDRRLGRCSSRAVPQADRDEIERLYKERYQGFTAAHFHERLRSHHGFNWGYTWTKTFLHARGLVEKAPRRGAHRRKRPRRPLAGMMLHQDASRHAWLSRREPLDLVVTMDDATSEIVSMFLVEEEGTLSSLRGLIETVSTKGLPCSLYTDRGSHYFVTPEAGGKVDKSARTQVGRALAQLGIEHIAAYSPEARGRSERMFRTLQDRLPKELALAGIEDDVEAANRFIREDYLPRHNARFTVEAAEAGSAWVAVEEVQWREVLCIRESRTAGKDNTVSWEGRRLQIPEQSHRMSYAKATVEVHAYPDGGLAIFHGPRPLARWSSLAEALGASGASPATAEGGAVLRALKDERGEGPRSRSARPRAKGPRPSLTAPARGALGTRGRDEARSRGRTKPGLEEKLPDAQGARPLRARCAP